MQSPQQTRVPDIVDALVAIGHQLDVDVVLDGNVPTGPTGQPETALYVFVGPNAAVVNYEPIVHNSHVYIERVDVACQISSWSGDTSNASAQRQSIRTIHAALRSALAASGGLSGVVDRVQLGSSANWSQDADSEGSDVALDFTVSTTSTI